MPRIAWSRAISSLERWGSASEKQEGSGHDSKGWAEFLSVHAASIRIPSKGELVARVWWRRRDAGGCPNPAALQNRRRDAGATKTLQPRMRPPYRSLELQRDITIRRMNCAH
jgi:hypothetical protein